MDTGQASTRNRWQGFFWKLNLPFLFGAIITAFLTVSNDPWWVVRGLGSSAILNASVSPFYVQIIGLGVPNTIPNSDVMGDLSRIALGLTSVALAWQAFFPRSVWRGPVLWLGLSSIAGLFLNFTLLLHSTQVIILQAYGVEPQLSGNSVISGVVLGTDYATYASPIITSSLAFPFFVGLAGFALLGGSEFFRFIFGPKITSYLPEFMTGLSGAFLSPPYQHAWLTTTSDNLNPLSKDPDMLTDDQLALSFERLLKALQPGASVSVILPPWATGLSNRLARVVSWAGFELENSQVIFRIPGQPENQLVFRKPATTPRVELGEDAEIATDKRDTDPESSEELAEPIGIDEGLNSDLESPVGLERIEGPPVDELIEDPVWARPELTPLEKAMITSATKAIERAGEPILYEELIDEVYMDLVNKEVDFASADQIEKILLDHVGKELDIIEQLDDSESEVVKLWWFGETLVQSETKLAKKLRAKLAGVGRRFWDTKKRPDAGNSFIPDQVPYESMDEDETQNSNR